MTRHGNGAALAVLLALVGCGGAAANAEQSTTPETTAATPASRRTTGPVQARGDREVRATVGPAGGELSLANGAVLVIPAGALAADTEIHFFEGPEAREAWNEETKRALGPVLEVEPALTAGSQNFRISAPAHAIPEGWTPRDLALGHEEEASGRLLSGTTSTRWQMWPARIEGDRFVADLPEFGGHRMQFGVSR